MNRLGQETSPYLLQHANHPVHWWPWSAEAFAEAQKRDVPVLLSIGYSTCHWCHVMAHESFEDEHTAAYMNQHFVNIKVDREERPDIDAVYMAATQAISGQGGWPMTVFLTPQQEPFFAGTYFPPEEGHQLPSFGQVLQNVSHTWQQQREKLLGNAKALTTHIQEQNQPLAVERLPDGFLNRATQNLSRSFDDHYGGFGHAPKFPAPTALDFLLSQTEGRNMALFTLEKMGAGGIYDHLGGGFHRYSVDQQWLVPHFEKMLYDNAQLVRSLLAAFQLTKEATFERLARETLGYLEREMHSAEGGFYSAQDADTKGVEGLTFTWTPQEIQSVLEEEATLFMRCYNVSDYGHFSDPHRPEFGRRNILHTPQSIDELEKTLELTGLAETLEKNKQKLHQARQKRPQPGTDHKILTSWNGLALAAFADAARILQEPHYLQLALQNAEFVYQKMRLDDGTLQHTYKDGLAQVEGLLEDHALYGLGLIALFKASGNINHLNWARELWQIVRRDFWNEETGVFFSTGGRAETLLTKQVQAFDSATPSDNGAAALLAAWMHLYFADQEAHQIAQRTVCSFASQMIAAPGGMGSLWQVTALLQHPHTEIAVVGTPAERAPLEKVLTEFYLPFAAITSAEAGTDLPVLAERSGGGTAYVCVNQTCQLPVQTADALQEQLKGL